MVDILKQVGTADWDREISNMSVNTPASLYAHALRMRVGMLSGLAALPGLTRLNVLLTSATENESPQSLGAGLCYPQSGQRRCSACPGARRWCLRRGWFSLCNPWLSVDPASVGQIHWIQHAENHSILKLYKCLSKLSIHKVNIILSHNRLFWNH